MKYALLAKYVGLNFIPLHHNLASDERIKERRLGGFTYILQDRREPHN